MRIPVSHNRWAIIDDEDWLRCSQYCWYATQQGISKTWYVCGYKIGEYHKPKIRLHRFILGLEKNDKRIVHHIDNNTLNSHKANLKIMSRSEHSRLHRKKYCKNQK